MDNLIINEDNFSKAYPDDIIAVLFEKYYFHKKSLEIRGNPTPEEHRKCGEFVAIMGGHFKKYNIKKDE